MKPKRIAARAFRPALPKVVHESQPTRASKIEAAAEAVLKQFPCTYPNAGWGSVVDVTGMEYCGKCVYCLLRAALGRENDSTGEGRDPAR